MAIAQTFIYSRPNAANGFDSFEKSYKGAGGGYRTITAACAATTAGLPLRAGAATYPQYTSGDEFQDIVQCSGQVKKIGDTWGVQIVDMVAGGDCAFAISGLFSMRLDASATAAVGVDAYIIPATGRVTHDATSNEYLGKFGGAEEANPLGRPAGDYCLVHLNQTEL